MALQFIQDVKGNTTGVFIPIEEWQDLKSKYTDLQVQEVENSLQLSSRHKQMVDDRLRDYYDNINDVTDLDETINSIEKTL